MKVFTAYLREKIHTALPTSASKRKLVGGALALLAIFWLLGMAAINKINDDPDYTPPTAFAGGSHAVAMTSALIQREAEESHWSANDPFFMPGHYLDNMPNYQMGLIYALSRFTMALSDDLGRSRGTSQLDPDLDRAVGLIKYSGTVWVFDPSTSLVPTAPSETQYKRARKALEEYNKRVAAGQAVFEPRSDNIIATLDLIASDLGSQSAVIEQHIAERHFFLLNTKADDIFYATKGRLYAYYLILGALQKDIGTVLKDRDLNTIWTQMLHTFREAVELHPFIIISATPDAQFMPSHLAAQGFYTLRARAKLREVSAILAK